MTSVHCITRTLLQADVLVRALLNADLNADGISLITSARCTCGHLDGRGPVGDLLAASGLPDLAVLDLPRAGLCVVAGPVLPILFGLVNGSRHAGIADALAELGLDPAAADQSATRVAMGWTVIVIRLAAPYHLPALAPTLDAVGATQVIRLDHAPIHAPAAPTRHHRPALQHV
jgi:hypothetical protein